MPLDSIPPAEYQTLNGSRTVRVTPKNGDWRDSAAISVHDSTLTIAKPRYPEYDTREYPVSYRFDELESVSTIKHEGLIYVESGVEHGSNHGAESQFFSKNFFVIDMGYLSGERRYHEHPRWGFGGTLLIAASDMDFRMGAKGRVRYRLNPHLSFDATAGPMLKSWNDGLINGFVGGVNVNVGSTFMLRSEYMTYEVSPWRDASYNYSSGYTYTQYPGGYEKVWYNGIAFHGTMGWVTASVGSFALVGFMIAALASLGGLD